jgi:hypothetical protein
MDAATRESGRGLLRRVIDEYPDHIEAKSAWEQLGDSLARDGKLDEAEHALNETIRLKKLEADLRQRGQPRWKHVMHLLRLLICARDLLRGGRLVLDVAEHREKLLAVRRGEVEWPEVEAWRMSLHTEVDDALARTALPAVPDTGTVNAWLYSVRARSARLAAEVVS